MKRKLVLFDIDGTILLTSGAGRRAIIDTLAAEVADCSGFHQIRFDGKTDPQIVTEMLTAAGHADPANPERLATLCQRYVDRLEAELRESRSRARVMPGVNQLLDRLEADEAVLLGLLTGNLARGAALKLRAARIDPARFVVGAFGSDAAHRHLLPAIAARRAERYFGRRPDGEEIVIIGDTPADVTCGQALAARAVGVATGSYSTSDLAEAGAPAVFADLRDTEAVLQAIMR